MTRPFALTLFSGLILLTLSSNMTQAEDIYAHLWKENHKQVSNFDFDPGTPLANRLKSAPKMILDVWAKWDGVSNYLNRNLSAAETSEIKKTAERLPSLYQKVFKKRLLGIYVIDHFGGSEVADFAFSENGETYCYLILSDKTFNTSIDALLTYKETTRYQTNRIGNQVQIHLSKNLSGLTYILLHEGAHVLDFVGGLTPFPAEAYQSMKKNRSGPFA